MCLELVKKYQKSVNSLLYNWYACHIKARVPRSYSPDGVILTSLTTHTNTFKTMFAQGYARAFFSSYSICISGHFT